MPDITDRFNLDHMSSEARRQYFAIIRDYFSNGRLNEAARFTEKLGNYAAAKFYKKLHEFVLDYERSIKK